MVTPWAGLVAVLTLTVPPTSVRSETALWASSVSRPPLAPSNTSTFRAGPTEALVAGPPAADSPAACPAGVAGAAETAGALGPPGAPGPDRSGADWSAPG